MNFDNIEGLSEDEILELFENEEFISVEWHCNAAHGDSLGCGRDKWWGYGYNRETCPTLQKGASCFFYWHCPVNGANQVTTWGYVYR